MDVAQSPAFLVEITGDGRTIRMNGALAGALGQSPSDLAGLEFLETFVPEADRERLGAILRGVMEDGETVTVEYRLKPHTGPELAALWRAAPVRGADGSITHLCCVGIAISDRWLLKRERASATEGDFGAREAGLADALRRATTELEQLRRLSTALDQIAEHAVITDREGRIEYVNHAFETISGYSREAAIGQTMRIVKSGRQDASFYTAMWATITGGNVFHGELVNRNAAGELFFDEVTISPLKDEAGTITHFMATGRDVSDRKLRDPLTGLPTRALLLERVDQAIARKRRNPEETFALLFLDLDKFSLVNDTYGTVAGDQVLMEVAFRVRQSVREVDAVAQVSHLDRDEFAILLEGLHDPSDGQRVAERMLEAIRMPLLAGSQETSISASVGIALSTTPYELASQVLRDAETAMRRAKADEQEPCQVFDRTMHARAVARLELEADLRQAVAADQFVLHYQPIVSLATGMVQGCEALVRWQHPKRGMVPPMQFIPLSEDTGLIVPLGMLVLKRACARARTWLDQGLGNLSVSVNLSARQFRQRDLVSAIQSVLSESGLPPVLLKLEITESTTATDPKAATRILTELKSLGIQLLMDDFGTGYSSLSFLTRFPLDKLKIDRSFVMKTPGSPEDDAVASTIVAMAHSLGMGVIAEGVETTAQLEFLRALGCEEMQGYLFSPPVPPEQFGELIRSGKTLAVA